MEQTARTCQCVVNTLNRRQLHAEGRTLFIKKAASRKTLHDRDSHIVLLADLIQMRPLRVDAFQGRIILLRKHGLDVFACRKHVKGRINAEQNHFHIAGLSRFHSHLWDYGS